MLDLSIDAAEVTFPGLATPALPSTASAFQPAGTLPSPVRLARARARWSIS